MATIALYAGKLNQMPGLIKDAKKSVDKLKTELSDLQKKAYNVDVSVCDLSEVISSIQASAQTQEDRIAALENFQANSEEFIREVIQIDNNVADTVNQNKENFYKQYEYLKPECEKSGWEKFCDKLEAIGEWCKKHWKEILIAVELIVAVVCLFVPGLQAFAGLILKNMLKGLVIGVISGAIMGGLSGYAQKGVKGILGGILHGIENGALMGLAFGGLGGFGSVAGKLFGCSSFMTGLFYGSSALSIGMLSFDLLALVYSVQSRFKNDTGMDLRLIDPTVGKFISYLNYAAHENPWYNAFQLAAGATAVFSGGYVRSATCFIAGTLVLTACSLVAIENIKAGDKVISTDPDTGVTEEKTVLETFRRSVTELVHLSINGENITTTHDHPFFVLGKGFVNAGKLRTCDVLLDRIQNRLTIDDISFETSETPTTVYNFKVEDYHTYYVGDVKVLVHNAGKDYNLIEPEKYTKLSEAEVRKILEDRGLDRSAIQDLIDSFDGPIYAREGYPGEVFTITETAPGEASGIFVTRGSAGVTPVERINNLALPPNNTAAVESVVELTRAQLLLEGKVAPQTDWAIIADDGIPRTGGAWQVVTDGGKYTGAIKR